MTLAYRETDPVSSRWTGLGRLLTGFEVDYNFYQIDSRLVSVESSITTGISVSSITSDGSSLTFHMSNSTTQGPFTMPTATFRDRGTWAASTFYAVNDTFTINGTLYRVLFDHTSSATSFSSTANDGAGHDYYAAMMSTAGNALPSGGAVNMMLRKSSSADYAVSWAYPLPSGGTQYQVLMKNSSTTQDASWAILGGTHVSFSGSTASGLHSTTVSDAIEELESNIQALTGTVGGLPGSLTLSGLSDVHFDTAGPVTGSMLYFGGLRWAASPALALGSNVLSWDGSALTPTALTDNIEFVIDGGGSTIATGMKGYIEVPWDCTLTRATLLADQTGSVVVNIYKCSYSEFDAGATHPVVGDKITDTTPPSISSGVKSQDTVLAGWGKVLIAGDILAYNIDSVTSIQRVTVSLKVAR